METMAVSPYPITPQTSHIRSSSQASRAQEASRLMQQADPQDAHLSAAASQESFVSAQSGGSSNGPRLQSSSSNVSQLTNYTDLTSPISHTQPNAFDGQYVAASRPDITRRRTPEDTLRRTNGADDFAVASPMSLTSPASTNGAKRTASGHVKNAPSLPNTPLTATFAGHRSRTDSISSTGSRAGELAASLKTRLGYAMHKVQNGWEHKDINEVEKLAAHKAHAYRHSMSHLDYSRRPDSSGLSNGTERMSMHEAYPNGSFDGPRSPPSKRHSGVHSSYMPSSQPNLSTAAAPRLQPAADIRPTSSQRQYHTAPSSQTNNYAHSAVMSPPRTPNHSHAHPRRPPTIRTDTQTAEAERDALQALFQLGSPHTSQNRHFASQASSSQASPLRSEFATPRRVTFARSESDGSEAAQRSSDEGSAQYSGP